MLNEEIKWCLEYWKWIKLGYYVLRKVYMFYKKNKTVTNETRIKYTIGNRLNKSMLAMPKDLGFSYTKVRNYMVKNNLSLTFLKVLKKMILSLVIDVFSDVLIYVKIIIEQ